MWLRFLCSLGLFLFFACDANKTEREELLSKVHSLQNELDSTEVFLLSNKIDTVSDLRLAISSVVLRIKNNLELSTVDTILAQKLNRYKVIGKNIDYLHRSYVNTKNAIQQEKKDLENLAYDIENGVSNFNEFSEFVEFEKGKLDTIKVSAKSFVVDKRKNLDGFFSLHHELNAFSLSLISEDND